MRSLFFFIIFASFLKAPIAFGQTSSSKKTEDCSMGRSKEIFLATKAQENKSFIHDQTGKEIESNFLQIPTCNSNAGKLFRITNGLKVLGQTGNVSAIINDDKLPKPDRCSLKNSDIIKNSQTPESIEDYFNTNVDLYRKCLSFILTENNEKEIKFPEQEGCIIDVIEPHKVKFTGGNCFFENNYNSRFQVEFEFDPICEVGIGVFNLNQLADREIMSFLTFGYSSEVGKEVSTQIVGTGHILYHYEALENKGQELTEDYTGFTPRYFDTLDFPEIDLGEPELLYHDNELAINTPLIVDHTCPKSCEVNNCKDSCRYRFPLVFEVKLNRITSGKKAEILNWYQGQEVPPNWQGEVRRLFSVFKTQGETLKVGKIYELEVIFGEPRFDNLMYQRYWKSTLPGISGPITLNQEEDSLSQVTSISSIGEIKKITKIEPISVIQNGSKLDELPDDGLVINPLSKRFWPPYYSKMCGTTACEKGNLEQHSVKRIQFRVKNYDDEDKKYRVEIIKKDFSSKINPSYTWEAEETVYGSKIKPKWPRLQCLPASFDKFDFGSMN